MRHSQANLREPRGGQPLSKFIASCIISCALLFIPTAAQAGKQLGNGMACKFPSDCASGKCVFKVCKAASGSGGKKLANGVSCKFPSDCASGKCVFKVCKSASSSGGKKLGNGAACKFPSDCESGKCTFKVCKAR